MTAGIAEEQGEIRHRTNRRPHTTVPPDGRLPNSRHFARNTQFFASATYRADGFEYEDAAPTPPLVMLLISGPKCNQPRPVALQLGALDLTSRAGDDVGTDLNRSNRVESQVQHPWVRPLRRRFDVAHHESSGIPKEEHRSRMEPARSTAGSRQKQNALVPPAPTECASACYAIGVAMNGRDDVLDRPHCRRTGTDLHQLIKHPPEHDVSRLGLTACDQGLKTPHHRRMPP